MKDSYSKVFKDKERVMFVFAHPDDLEIICGGLVARLIDDGKEVRVVSTTNGEKGMHDSLEYSNQEFADLRKSSQKLAALELGVSSDQVFNLDIPDGEFENNLENIGKVVKHIREFKPDIIATHNPTEVINSFNKSTKWVNHRDHRHTATVVMDAVYPYSRDRGFFRDHFEEGLEPHSLDEMLFSDSYMSENRVYFEVTKYQDIKRKALEKHLDGGAISKDELEEFMEESLQDDGKNYDCLGYWKV